MRVAGPDRAFRTALRRFLVDALDGGEYGGDHYEAFRRLPTYDAVAHLVFPS